MTCFGTFFNPCARHEQCVLMYPHPLRYQQMSPFIMDLCMAAPQQQLAMTRGRHSNERKRWSPQRLFLFLVNRCALRFWQIRPPLGKSAHGIYSKRVVAMWGFIWIYFFLVHQDGATERFGREMRMKLHGASRWLQNRPKTTPPQNHHFDPCDGHNLAF